MKNLPLSSGYIATVCALMAVSPTAALAHTGSHDTGMFTGLVHSLTEMDHILAFVFGLMLMVLLGVAIVFIVKRACRLIVSVASRLAGKSDQSSKEPVFKRAGLQKNRSLRELIFNK